MNLAVKPSLRERQKIRRRTAILNAGRALFNRQGYSSTSMEAIAEAAEVGIATVYNYFGTKGRLLADILQPDFDLLYQQGETLLAQPPKDPEPGVLALIDIYQRFQSNWKRKDLLIAIMGPGLSAEPALDELSREAESKVKVPTKYITFEISDIGARSGKALIPKMPRSSSFIYSTSISYSLFLRTLQNLLK